MINNLPWFIFPFQKCLVGWWGGGGSGWGVAPLATTSIYSAKLCNIIKYNYITLAEQRDYSYIVIFIVKEIVRTL